MAFKLKIPKSLRGRIREVAKKHDYPSEAALAAHFVDRGIEVYGAPAGELKKRLEHVACEQGYSSVDELIEHLLRRGLRAYEDTTGDPAVLEARLRGLGYID